MSKKKKNRKKKKVNSSNFERSFLGGIQAKVSSASKQTRGLRFKKKHELHYSSKKVIGNVISKIKHLSKSAKQQVLHKYYPISYYGIWGGVLSNEDKHSVSLDHELYWSFNLFSLFTSELCDFLKLKNKYEINLLLGNYEICIETISEIKHLFGHSIWLLHNELLLAQCVGGLEANRSLSKKIQRESNARVGYLAQSFSVLVENHLHPTDYENKMNFLRNPKNTHKVYTYLLYECMPLHYHSNASLIVQCANDNSFIDLYETSVCALIHGIADSYNSDFSELLQESVKKISLEIPDIRLSLINNVFSVGKNISDSQITNDVNIILDCYTDEKYATAAEYSIKFLKKNPLNLDIYNIYIKSLLFQSLPNFKINDFLLTENSSFANSILIHLYNILSNNDKILESLTELKKTAYLLCRTSIGAALYSKSVLYDYDTSPDVIRYSMKKNLLCSLSATPHFSFIFDIECDRKLFLKEWENSFGDHSALKVYMCESIDKKDNSLRNRLHLAEKLLSQNKYSETIQVFEELYKETDIPFYKERIIIGLLTCYKMTNSFKLELKLWADTIVQNKYILTRVSIKEFYDRYKDKDKNDEEVVLDWCVVFHYYLDIMRKIDNDAKQALYGTYAALKEILNINMPSEIFQPEILVSSQSCNVV